MARDGHINRKTQDKLRASIRAQELINAVQAHVLDGAKMTTTQLRGAEILLRKIQPDLTSTQLAAEGGLDMPILKIVPSNAA